jgi:phage terminase large subunit-like protein
MTPQPPHDAGAYRPRSEAERVAMLGPEGLATWFKENEKRLNGLAWEWNFWARDDQRAPPHDWRIWFVMAGRGFGKTRMAAEWIRAAAEADGSLRIALVAATLHEARSVMVEGDSGLLAIAPPDSRPIFESSNKRLVWPNGATAYLYSAGEPDSLRGPQHHLAWGDEVAKWDSGKAAWDNLELTLRIGDAPRMVATTTPRPVALVQALIKQPGVAITRGTMDANTAQLSKLYRDAMQRQYGGTRLGRQELEGELIIDLEDAMWPRDTIETSRIDLAPALKRIVIGVDPPATSTGDACGIIVAALGEDGRGYVLDDASVERARPEVWAAAVAASADRWNADCVLAESNMGGEMVLSTLRAADCNLPVRTAFATRSKAARAEPVSIHYSQGRISHVGRFAALEDQMCGMTLSGGYEGPGRSPDRADALVWALTELMRTPKPGPSVRWL